MHSTWEIGFTDFAQPDLQLERTCVAAASMMMRVAQPQCHSEAAVIAFADGLDALVVQEAPLTRRVLESLPRLRIISLPQVGTNSVDLAAAADLGIWVSHVPDANATEVATHATAMTLALARHLPQFDAAVRAGNWDYTGTGALTRPGKLKVGLVGMGRIGRLFASYVRPCVAAVAAFDPGVAADAWPEGIERCITLEELLDSADIVSLHVPLTPGTRNLMNAARLARMKPGAMLVNVSRGAVVDIPALLACLDSGHLASAALDVLPQEPPDPADPVLAHPRILLSPHAAFYSIDSDEEARRRSITTIAALRANGAPHNVVVRGQR